MGEGQQNVALRGLISGTSAEAGPGATTVERALQAVRAHLGMEVAYVSRFAGERTVFRAVDAPGNEGILKPGDSNPIDDVYCRHILEGRLPAFMPDTAAVPFAMAMPVTKAIPIGAHLSVPLRMPDGSVYGMFCCLGFNADKSLNERDLRMMGAFADLAAYEIARELEATTLAEERRARIRGAIDDAAFFPVYQPIWHTGAGRPVGVECLTRFTSAPERPPNVWFGEAAEAGMGVELELAAIRRALAEGTRFPAHLYFTVNASPDTILAGDLAGALSGMPLHRIVLEITEHAPVEDYAALAGALDPLRAAGMRVAVDDAGAGYSSLQHILHLRPDIIKLDMALTRDIDRDPARRALASALIAFGSETGCEVIAEGVETAAELAALRSLGVEKAQGYHLGRPMTADDALRLFDPQTFASQGAA
ncbi:sensor domain-containing phosphodiesterase [Faunimonas sp. B44]|uniref:sensor domain-containing phosphodiesterase n=1 Tax=Faunimonas sp. B44 TaxID=3461493 RepID=UPI004043FE1D